MIMSGELAYRLIFSDGRDVRLFSDGRAEGLPDGTVVMNRVSHLLRVARSGTSPLNPVQDSPLPDDRTRFR